MGASSASAGRPLRVGIQLPETEYVARWPKLREMGRLAEQIGLDSLWVGDHYLYRDELGTVGPWEAWTQLAALAAVTDRITLGPLVAATSFHLPGVLAKLALNIDEISGGRLVLGLGAGWNEPEYHAFGFPFDERVSRFEEAFLIIRTLLREGRIDHSGRFFTLRDCELVPRGPRPEGPPLMVGSIGPRMLRITMPHVQLWNAWFSYYGNTPDAIPRMRDLVNDACRDVGRDPATVERTVAVLVRLSGLPGVRNNSRDGVDPISGTAEEIAMTLRAFAAQGIGEVQLVIDPITPAGIEALVPVLEHLDRGA